MRSSRSPFLILMVLLLAGSHVQSAHADGAFFFDDEEEEPRKPKIKLIRKQAEDRDRSNAVFSDEEREQLIRDSYACNSPTVKRSDCESVQESARETIEEKTRSNHERASEMLENVRSLHKYGPDYDK